MPAKQIVAARKLDGVTLPVIEAEHFDARKALQRPGEAGGGILSAGKQHQRGFGWQLIVHCRAHSTHRTVRQSVEMAASPARFAGMSAHLAAYRPLNSVNGFGAP